MAEEKLSPQEALEAQKAQCPFCKIVKGEIPSFKVYEDEKIIAIADINPVVKGHILVLPKEHYPIIQLMPPDVMTRLFERIKFIVKGVKNGTPADAATVYIANGYAAGQQSAHFMAHILPRDKDDSLQQFSYKPAKLEEQKAQQLVGAIKNAIGQYIGGVKQTVNEEQKKMLAELIESDLQIKELLLNNPDELVKKISSDVKLKTLFSGVDVKALSGRLRGAN